MNINASKKQVQQRKNANANAAIRYTYAHRGASTNKTSTRKQFSLLHLNLLYISHCTIPNIVNLNKNNNNNLLDNADCVMKDKGNRRDGR
jgi:hypothetical protein